MDIDRQESAVIASCFALAATQQHICRAVGVQSVRYKRYAQKPARFAHFEVVFAVSPTQRMKAGMLKGISTRPSVFGIDSFL